MKITFLGGGNMTTALIGGLLRRGTSAASLTVIEMLAGQRTKLTQEFGVSCASEADDAALNCDVLVLAVKPQQMHEAITPLRGRLKRQLLLSIAAGIRLPDLTRWLDGYTNLVRAMPNTPALIGAGVTGLYAHPAVSSEQRVAAEQVLAAAGTTLWLDNESMLDAVTAVSGSGPAYVFYFIEALQAAALELGLPPQQARQHSLETFLGAAQLAAQSQGEVAVLRERVTSKGGTTERALQSLEADQVKAALIRAVKAAAARSQELGDAWGKN